MIEHHEILDDSHDSHIPYLVSVIVDLKRRIVPSKLSLLKCILVLLLLYTVLIFCT